MKQEKKKWSQAMTFIVLFGIVSLFSDMTHEGASSIRGAYLSLLGASAGMIGFVSGLGELVGYSMRYVFGKLTDKTTPAEALQVVKAYPDRDKLLPETQQQLLMMEFGTYLNSTGDVDGAVLILDKVAELKTGTEAGMQAPRIKAGILANKDKIKAQIDAAKKAQSK